jgi:hypothetical protein
MRKVDGWCWGLGLSLLVPMLAGCGKDDGSRDSAADGGATGIPLDGGDDGATGGADDDDDGDEGDKLDVGSNATGGLEGCGGDAGNSGGGGMGGEEEFEFSYIWIANSV